MKRSPLKRVGTKQAKKLREYAKLRKRFLTANPMCNVCRNAQATDVHHKAKRGKNLNAVETWMAVDRDCHEKIHREPAWARQRGYIE